MKKVFFFCLLMILSVLYSEKQKIAVFPFNGVRNDYNMTLTAENQMISLLVNQGIFDVIERSQLDKIVKEQQLSLTGLIDVSDAVKIGKISGVRYAVIGSVPNVNYRAVQKVDDKGEPYLSVDALVVIQIRVIDIKTAGVLFSKTYNAKPGGGLLGSILSLDTSADPETTLAKTVKRVYKKVAKDMTNAFPMSGYILSIEGNIVTIDIGKQAGVKKKMLFDVIKETEKIHPKTKKLIVIEKKVGLLKVKEVTGDESSECIIKKGEDKIAEMMKVNLRKK